MKIIVLTKINSNFQGSTCAFCESILRKRGFKTGLYTSPHLFSVTERIRINGQPLSKEKFADYFWDVYETAARNSSPGFKFPEQAPYFKFLTILAFNIFWKEKVDVAIVEGKLGVVLSSAYSYYRLFVPPPYKSRISVILHHPHITQLM